MLSIALCPPREACHASLERLRAEYIDLYYLQRHESDVPIEESLEALKVRARGRAGWGCVMDANES